MLMHVRIFDGSGSFDLLFPYLEAIDLPTDGVSRVWATNVNATSASGIDSLGLTTTIQFSPIPSLTSEFRRFICQGCPTNVIQISWPSQPSIFQLQQSFDPGITNGWGSPNTQIFGDPRGGG